MANAICERLVGTLRRDCLDHLLLLNERHAERLLREYVRYSHGRHRSLRGQPPDGQRWLAPRPAATSRELTAIPDRFGVRDEGVGIVVTRTRSPWSARLAPPQAEPLIGSLQAAGVSNGDGAMIHIDARSACCKTREIPMSRGADEGSAVKPSTV
jgi:hypothetical protein